VLVCLSLSLSVYVSPEERTYIRAQRRAAFLVQLQRGSVHSTIIVFFIFILFIYVDLLCKLNILSWVCVCALFFIFGNIYKSVCMCVG
jgi:hypothetical protein